MDALRQNLRYGLRALRRSPGFTLVAAFTLALGIGATTAIFTLLDSIVFEPLPYAQSERLVSITHPVPGLNPEWKWGPSSASYFHFRDNAASLEELGVYQATRMTMAGGGTAEEVETAYASASLFTVLGARPLHGRLLRPEENESRDLAGTVAVLSHDFWRTRLGADPAIVGTMIQLEGRPIEVVGVTEPGFGVPGRDVAVWLPAYLSRSMYLGNSHVHTAIGRLGEGVSLEAARADLARLTGQLPEAMPDAYAGGFVDEARFSTEVRTLQEHVVGDFARVLWILLGAVGVVLLIAGANVANLFFVRMEARRREVAIRSALGAGRKQLTGHYLTESLLLALLAGLVGIGLADAGIQLLVALDPDIPRLAEVGVGHDGVAFALGIALLIGLPFGLLAGLGRGGHAALRDSGRGLTASRGRHLVRGSLVVGQVALALVLLTAAGLLLETFRNLRAVDPGIRTDNVLTVQVSLPAANYPTYAAVGAFHRDAAERIAALPGVEHVGAIQSVPLGGGYDGGCNLVMPEGWNPRAERYPCVHTPRVTPGFFPALGIAVDGREPDWREASSGQAGAIVSRAFAERYWPGEDPLTRRITAYSGNQPYFQVVGVAADVRAAGLDEPPVEAVYFPVVPGEGITLWSPPRGMTLVLRTATARPQELTGAVRQAIAGVDPGVAIGDVRTMDRVVATHGSVARVGFAMLLLGIAAIIALVLGAVGLYGVVAYVVGQRTGEIGIRMALGARSSQVGRLVVRQSLVLALAGIALGTAAALGVTRVLRSFLYETSPTDPAVLGAVAVLLLGIALAASIVPARRAARVDPMIALRNE